MTPFAGVLQCCYTSSLRTILGFSPLLLCQATTSRLTSGNLRNKATVTLAVTSLLRQQGEKVSFDKEHTEFPGYREKSVAECLIRPVSHPCLSVSLPPVQDSCFCQLLSGLLLLSCLVFVQQCVNAIFELKTII